MLVGVGIWAAVRLLGLAEALQHRISRFNGLQMCLWAGCPAEPQRVYSDVSRSPTENELQGMLSSEQRSSIGIEILTISPLFWGFSRV